MFILRQASLKMAILLHTVANWRFIMILACIPELKNLGSLRGGEDIYFLFLCCNSDLYLQLNTPYFTLQVALRLKNPEIDEKIVVA